LQDGISPVINQTATWKKRRKKRCFAVVNTSQQTSIRDINQIKAATKATMGSCGGKTCLSLIKKVFREEGVSLDEVTDPTRRPVFVEVPLETLAKNHQEGT